VTQPPTPTESPEPPEAEALRRDAHELRRVARTLARRSPWCPALPVEAAAARLEERLDLGIDHTIVALLGGTGSGKSTLFNAIAQMDFSATGAVRPTTTRVTACVWGPDAAGLLRWLGVEREDVIRRDSALEDHIAALRGLILLDLPDYDSQVPAHREAVERVLPLADLLVWVTDPQKYADPALHSRYLGELGGRDGAMVVVLNQIDRLAADDVATVADDLTGLLHQDGVADPDVLPVSALEGVGVDGLRDRIADATHGRTMAGRHLAAEVAADARLLAESIGDPSPYVKTSNHMPAWVTVAQAEAVGALVEATNLAVIVEAIRKRHTPPPPGRPPLSAIQEVLGGWARRANGGLPTQWADSVVHYLGSPKNIEARLGEALDEVTSPGPAPRRWFGGRQARRRAEAYRSAATKAVTSVVMLTMTAPTIAVIEDWVRAHRQLTQLSIPLA
jgi:GTPase Era involved in 16S rRNA processing